MSCGCNRPGHGPEPHSPVPLHAPLPSHSAIPLKGGSVFFNVIDHLKRQIDRLFKGKADLVDGKVPDDQLPERQVGTVAWDDVKGKPTEFPPSAHGHEDLRQLIVGVSAAVTQIDRRVEFAETAAASAVGTANSAQDLARAASLTAGDAELEARNAAGDAGTALEKAEEALNLAKAVDEIVITEDEVSSIRDMKTKIDASGNVYAANGIYNGKFIRRDKSNGTTLEVPFTRVIENFGKDYEYQSTDGTITIVYSSGNGYLKINGSIVMEEPYGLDPQNGDDLGVYEDDSYVYEFKRAYASFPVNPTDRLSFASQLDSLMPKRVSNDTDTSRIDGDGNVYGSDTILAYYYCGDDIYAYDAANSGGGDYAFTGPDGQQIKYGSGGAVFFNLRVVANTTANLNPLDGKTVLPDFTRDSKTYKFKATSYSISPTPTDRLARESQLAGYALKTDVPKRVSNDADTSRIDGEGNVYDVTNTPTDNYITVTYNTGLVRRYNYNQIDTSGNYEFKFTGGNDYIQYKQDTGYVSLNYSRVATANKVDPLNDEQIVVSSISATNITSIVHTPQKSTKTEEMTDRLARGSQLTEFVKASEIANAKSAAGTSVTLTDRDCATVNYAAGLTLAFAEASGLRQFEILIKGCEADGSIGVPSKVYRGASDAFDLEEGDNHLSFAEQADGSFVVHRMLANIITIGG